MYLYTNKIFRKTNNILIKANAEDHLNDVFTTASVLIGVVAGFFNIFWVDGVVALIIAVRIFVIAVGIFLDSYDVLMDKSISKETKIKVYDLIKKHEEIKRVTHFNSTPVGYRYQISLTIFVDGNMTTFESHKIADDLEKEIIKTFPEIYLAVIHVNPMDITKLEDKKKK